MRREKAKPVRRSQSLRGEESVRSAEPLRREEKSLRGSQPVRGARQVTRGGAAARASGPPPGALAASAPCAALTAAEIARLPRATLEAMHAAGCEILECYRVLRKAGLNVVGEVLRGQGTFYEMEHYPRDDVFDAESHAQYYYHAHRAGEHGHFHTFLRRAGMPEGAAPMDLPHAEPWPEGDDQLAHLVAISMDGYGYPTGLFAPNRWVVDDAWFAGEDLIAMLGRFRIDHAYPSWPVNRWLGAMFGLFRPHIERLLRARDRAFEARRRLFPGEDVLEQREIEIFAAMPVAVEETIAAVRAALAS
jgi:hypothetical protein